MKISIIPVSSKNEAAALELKVASGQEGYVESVGQCLAEARQFQCWRPVLIYNGEMPVGFAMYGLWENEGAHGRGWLDRLFIDGRYQGLGYGRRAFQLLIERLREEYHCKEIFLSVYKENEGAISLYKQEGFDFNGELDIHGEAVMIKQFQ